MAEKVSAEQLEMLDETIRRLCSDGGDLQIHVLTMPDPESQDIKCLSLKIGERGLIQSEHDDGIPFSDEERRLRADACDNLTRMQLCDQDECLHTCQFFDGADFALFWLDDDRVGWDAAMVDYGLFVVQTREPNQAALDIMNALGEVLAIGRPVILYPWCNNPYLTYMLA